MILRASYDLRHLLVLHRRLPLPPSSGSLYSFSSPTAPLPTASFCSSNCPHVSPQLLAFPVFSGFSSVCLFSFRPVSSSASNPRPVRLKVKGVRHGMSVADLRNFFEGFPISSSVSQPIDIIRDCSERLTGYAHVYFDEEDEARKAQKALNRRYLMRSMMELSLDYDSLTHFYRKQYFIEKLKRYDYPDVDNYSKT
eukprot:GHVS01093346.1.p1 GENE.GHVS01093346.1~~GHVS01093346.1.p1  ORF type:complete len:196 (+),score=20.80 GHVS01093346.1:183-770(+)